MRRVLPQRRRAETFTVVHWDQPFVVTVGFFDDGTPGEVFIDSRKTGGDVRGHRTRRRGGDLARPAARRRRRDHPARHYAQQQRGAVVDPGRSDRRAGGHSVFPDRRCAMSDANDPFSFDAEYGDPDFVRSAKDPNRPPQPGKEWEHNGRASRRGDRARRRAQPVRGPRRWAAARRRTVSKQRYRHPQGNGDIHQGQNRKRDAPRRHDAAAARRTHPISDRRQQDGVAVAETCALWKQAERKQLPAHQ